MNPVGTDDITRVDQLTKHYCMLVLWDMMYLCFSLNMLYCQNWPGWKPMPFNARLWLQDGWLRADAVKNWNYGNGSFLRAPSLKMLSLLPVTLLPETYFVGDINPAGAECFWENIDMYLCLILNIFNYFEKALICICIWYRTTQKLHTHLVLLEEIFPVGR